MRDEALKLAAKGIRVFPVGPDKAPRTPRGFYDATSDEEKISAWDWDGCMIGAAIPSGQVVIDVDPRNGGEKTMDLFPSLPETRVISTKSGGYHVYFRVPEDVKLRGSLGPGVDVKRAGKGYVVVPPSPGYEVVHNGPPQPAPDWLIEELRVAERNSVEESASSPKYFPFEKGTAYGLGALDREAGRLAQAQPGERNNALNRAAFAMAQLEAGGEIERHHAFDVLSAVALQIGLHPQEIKQTFDSGWKAGQEAPRQAPDVSRASSTSPVARQTTIWTPQQGEEEIDESKLWVDWLVDEPELPFFIHPILPKNAYLVVYGATEASKSMAWVGLLSEASRRNVRTSVYSLENPPATDRKRLRQWNPNPANFRLTNEPLDLNDFRQLERLVAREQDWGDGRGTDVILVDTYSHAFNSRSEDGNAKAIEFARRVRFIMAAVGCSFVVIDHTGYMQADEPRDASAKRQQVDVAILMKKSGVWQPGQPAGFTMENKKAARFGNPFFLTGEIRDVPATKGLELGWIGEHPRWETEE